MEQNTSENNNISEKPLEEKIKDKSQFIDILKSEMSKVIIGQEQMTNRLLVAMLSNGHILLEGVPGLAKTLAISTLSKIINTQFSRVQFTPDLLPADLIGTIIYNQKKEEFSIKKGPIFANFILADEINRAPAKVQSALLEAMQERQVTIGDNTFPLPEPFLVLATQNPVEQEGTYPLPEAQMDRFMLKVVLTYPKKEEEKIILRKNISNDGFEKINPVVNPSEIIEARKLVKEIYLDSKIEQYIVDIVFASRFPENYNMSSFKNLISFGGSPRASISLGLAAKANAFINHRSYVIPEDVRNIATDVLRHRIGITYEAEAEEVTSENIIQEILNKVYVP